MKDEIIVGRPYSTFRISAYECEVDISGNPVKRGRRVKVGWYRTFSSDRLQKEIMPKLSEYAAQGAMYPFLITTHQLEDKSKVTLPEDKSRKVTAKDIKFSRRRRRSPLNWAAVVYSPTEYKVLPDK